MALFSQSGTLAGIDVSVSPFSGAGSPSTYLEVHNLDHAAVYSVIVSGVTFRLPATRKLVLTEPVGSVILNGVGDYLVVASNLAGVQPQPGPRVEPSLNFPIVATPVSPADNITLQDTGTILQVKAAGLTRPLVNTGIGVEVGQGGQYTLGSMAGLDFAVGETVTITVTGGSSETYTARVAAASPNEFTIGAGPGPGQSLQNLAAKVAALQADVDSAQNGVEDFISFWTADYSGAALTVSDTSVNVSSFGPLVTDRLPGRVVTQLIRRTIVASDVTRNSIWLGMPIGVTVLDALVQWRDATGLAKAWDGTISPSGNTVWLIRGVAAWNAAEVLSVLVQYTLP